MSILQTFQARLLGPLTYHSVPDAGAAGATVTAPFLGDTALTYAIHYSMHGHPIPMRFGTSAPNYREDFKHFNTICGVGLPVGPVDFLAPEYVASSFMSEGYEQKAISSMESKHRRSKVANTPYRPWRQIQSLAPTSGMQNVFTFVAVSRGSLPDRFTLRMGLGRGCLIAVQAVPDGDTCAVNRHTVEGILKRSMDGVEHTSVSAPLAQFQIYHGVHANVARDLLTPVS